jgi:hypothetical protein
MRKLLALAVLVIGLVITSYAVSHRHSHKAPVAPTVIEQTPAEVIEQEHSEVTPPAPEAPYVVPPTDPKLAAVPTPKPRVKKRRHVKPRPQLVLPPPLVPHCICKA